MKDDQEIKIEIQRNIRDMAEILGHLSTKYKEEPLLKDAQEAFLSLSVHVGKALDIQLQ